MTYEYPQIANQILMRLFKHENEIISLEELRENQNINPNLNEQCLDDLQEDTLISEIRISKILFYQITSNGIRLIKSSIKNGLKDLHK